MNDTITEDEVLAGLKVGNRVWFEEERMPYTVQARSEQFIVCTKPFAAQKTVIYTILDLYRKVRGPDNLVFSMGYETREQCQARLQDLVDGAAEVSYRQSRILPINVKKTQS